MFKHPPSHLDIESPQFAGRPHVWIQWKGTNVCADIHCDCGEDAGHVDGDFMYFVQCPACHQIWEVGTHIALYKLTPEDLAARNIHAESPSVQHPE